MATTVWLSFQPFEARRLDLPDLLGKQAQSRHLAPQLGQRVRRYRLCLWSTQPLELLRGRAQGRFEAADAEPCERALDSVANARALADEVLALAARPLGVFLLRLGIAAMLQCSRSPRSQPRKARFNNAVSSRSVFARRCSRETAMLFGWIT